MTKVFSAKTNCAVTTLSLKQIKCCIFVLGAAQITPVGSGPLGVGQKSQCVQKPRHKSTESRNKAHSVFRAHASWRGNSRNRGADLKKTALLHLHQVAQCVWIDGPLGVTTHAKWHCVFRWRA